MYMQNFRCRVINSPSTKAIGLAQKPVPCSDDPSSCISGPKQMIVWNQAEGNNVGNIGRSPGYNNKMGYKPGAQNDIFVNTLEEEAASGDPSESHAVGTSPNTTSPSPTNSPDADLTTAATSLDDVKTSTAPDPSKTNQDSDPGSGSKPCKSRKSRGLRRRHHARHVGSV